MSESASPTIIMCHIHELYHIGNASVWVSEQCPLWSFTIDPGVIFTLTLKFESCNWFSWCGSTDLAGVLNLLGPLKA